MNQNQLLKLSLLTICVAALIWVWMPRATYPKISSPDSDRVLRLLSTACGSQSSERLQNVKDEIAKLSLPDAERNAFQQIIALADEGRWKEAQAASIQMASDQVN
jgi:hypothetical protein